MAFAQQMRIEFVHIIALFSAYIAFPWVAFGMAAFMEEVQCLIGKLDAAEQTLEHTFVAMMADIGVHQYVCIGAGRCDGAI